MENPYGKDYIDLPLAELGVRLAHDINRILRLEPGLKVSIFKEHDIKGGLDYQAEIQSITEDVFHFTDPIQKLTSPGGTTSRGRTSFANPLTPLDSSLGTGTIDSVSPKTSAQLE